jgi:phosphoenolpyruvate-protein kinase (PTS system EI component)
MNVYPSNRTAQFSCPRELGQLKVKCKRPSKIGICGQAPSDYPEFAQFLVERGINSISLNPDMVIQTKQMILETEKKLKKQNKTAKSKA